MRVIRRVTRRGNSCQVTMPQPMLDFVRVRIGDMMVVETESIDRIVLRRLRPEDLSVRDMPSVTLSTAEPVTR